MKFLALIFTTSVLLLSTTSTSAAATLSATLRSAPLYPYECPYTIVFTGTITAMQRGRVDFKFIRSDGVNLPVQSLTFLNDAGGTQNVSTTWTFPSNYSGWIALQILSPKRVASAHANFRMYCLVRAGRQREAPNPLAPAKVYHSGPPGNLSAPFATSDISPDPKAVAGSCPIWVGFQGDISLSKNRPNLWPTHLSYVFIRSDGSRSAVFNQPLDPNPNVPPPNGVQTANHVVVLLVDRFLAGRFGRNVTEQDTLHVTSPVLADATASVSVNCSPRAQPVPRMSIPPHLPKGRTLQ